MELDWGRLGYVAVCLVLPAAWGGFAAWLFGRLDRRRAARVAADLAALPAARRPPRPTDRPPLDYTI